jgi:hypothetical protein
MPGTMVIAESPFHDTARISCSTPKGMNLCAAIVQLSSFQELLIVLLAFKLLGFLSYTNLVKCLTVIHPVI